MADNLDLDEDTSSPLTLAGSTADEHDAETPGTAAAGRARSPSPTTASSATAARQVAVIAEVVAIILSKVGQPI
jgi:hypothetical protein